MDGYTDNDLAGRTRLPADDMKKFVAHRYDQIADVYLERFGASAVRAAKLAELCDGLPAGARVLDLGCGAGVPVAQHLIAHELAVSGVDASAAQIERARRNVPEAYFIQADMTTIELPLGAFDAVSGLLLDHARPARRARRVAENNRWLAQVGWKIPREPPRYALRRLPE